MEYEIVEAVKSNNVVILCAETGSGKSTQVPQFLYEAGFTGKEDDNAIYSYEIGKAFSNTYSLNGMMIGITQPRRVAAISTAKRVAFEMGCDITPAKEDSPRRGNLVAYQTRYETAGMGLDTRIKFMTDGVLLQEIQRDLLLRQYSAICLDELHERNLNGDVLLGLLSSATLPLRQKAAEEGSIPPLKLIIMSATLRVEDFNSNRLFPSFPAVVKVPGRNFPVTIHHSKATSLDDYGKYCFACLWLNTTPFTSYANVSTCYHVTEMLAFEKVCKIHRNLPDGGILVFLTGRQEIMRMVQRLRKRFGSPHSVEFNDRKRTSTDSEDTEMKDSGAEFREMDDEEIDGDLFQRDDDDDDKSLDQDSTCDDEKARYESSKDKPVYILPLYSMLSTGDQAKVFAPVPEGHRLIVVATNIAETSVT
jgi:ATP-dependent RNA helicase DHX37/DHR1